MSGVSNVVPFRPRAGSLSRRRESDARLLRGSPEKRDPAAAQELLGSLSTMFRAAGCPGLAEAFVEAGGRCG